MCDCNYREKKFELVGGLQLTRTGTQRELSSIRYIKQRRQIFSLRQRKKASKAKKILHGSRQILKLIPRD